MKIAGALALLAGVAGGYLGARELMRREAPPQWLPEPLRPAHDAMRTRLLLARQRARTVVEEFERERASAEAELLRDYHERVGRPLSADAAAHRPAGT